MGLPGKNDQDNSLRFKAVLGFEQIDWIPLHLPLNWLQIACYSLSLRDMTGTYDR